MHASSHHQRKTNRGLTPVWVSAALEMLLQVLTAGVGIRNSGRDTWAAGSAAQEPVKCMHKIPLRDLFQQYRGSPPLAPI